MIPSFGISSSQATLKEGEEKEKEEFDPAFLSVELRDYFVWLKATESRRGKTIALNNL